MFPPIFLPFLFYCRNDLSQIGATPVAVVLEYENIWSVSGAFIHVVVDM